MNRKIKRITASVTENKDILNKPCVCIGVRIRDQMYNGVDLANSTLVTGQYDNDDSWDVDPACDMSTDRMSLDVRESVPVSQTPPSE